MTRWLGFDSFFNACLLRRPAREFYEDADSLCTSFRWVDGSQRSRGLDARRTTKLRYFSRDEGLTFSQYAKDVTADAPKESADPDAPDPDAEVATFNNSPPDSGLAAWNDFSPIAQAARRGLIEASGIRVPSRSFIVWVVAGYLIVLVPVNWIIFRLIGRVEWAWAAAPLIAIACTILVIRLAQLNVGFARSQNEIAVVEMQAGYSRAHVTRYTALYTSLATGYQFQLDDPGGQALPFARVEKPSDFKMLAWQGREELTCRRGENVTVSGLGVASNSIELVHSEEMVDLGGSLSLEHAVNGTLKLTNHTQQTLEAAQAIRRQRGGRLEIARIGKLSPQAAVVLEFEPTSGDDTATSRKPSDAEPSGELSLAELKRIAAVGKELEPGQIRLVASVADMVPSLQVEPIARQTRQVTLLVALLDDGPGVMPEPDVNRPLDADQPTQETRAVVPR